MLIVSIDRIEGTVAVAESDDGRRWEIPARQLEPAPAEGMIYNVPLDKKMKPVWAKAVRDEAEEARRKVALGKRLAALRKRDRGGDIEL
jgi:hypothetical protein